MWYLDSLWVTNKFSKKSLFNLLAELKVCAQAKHAYNDAFLHICQVFHVARLQDFASYNNASSARVWYMYFKWWCIDHN